MASGYGNRDTSLARGAGIFFLDPRSDWCTCRGDRVGREKNHSISYATNSPKTIIPTRLGADVAKAERLLYQLNRKLGQQAKHLRTPDLRRIVNLYDSIRSAVELIGMNLLMACHGRPAAVGPGGLHVTIRKTGGCAALIGG
jgi:hypothetical protein